MFIISTKLLLLPQSIRSIATVLRGSEWALMGGVYLFGYSVQISTSSSPGLQTTPLTCSQSLLQSKRISEGQRLSVLLVWPSNSTASWYYSSLYSQRQRVRQLSSSNCKPKWMRKYLKYSNNGQFEHLQLHDNQENFISWWKLCHIVKGFRGSQ